MISEIVFICVGGALGALARGGLTDIFKKRSVMEFPLITLCINIIACFIAGTLLTTSIEGAVLSMLSIGFLGSFSTLSTMNFEAVGMFLAHEYKLCAFYLVLSYVSTIGAAAVGLALFSH